MKFALKAGIALTTVAAAGVGVFSLAARPAWAADLKPPEIGAEMPGFSLKDTTGKEHSLADLKGQVVVLTFCSQECPYSRGADPTLNALAKKYTDGVTFFGVDSSVSNSVEDINQHIKDAEVPYAILKDSDNVYADAVGAKVTPEVFVVDKDGKLAYHGAPDNRTAPDAAPSENYLDDALAALTSGEDVKTTTAKTWGCGIKRGKR
ncbi:MAG: redoxin domain-containing protein [Candidatus Hydrogenedens sp.]|nr:redoxin domain-containing protein [Candidatus Hydrogenedens sp.]